MSATTNFNEEIQWVSPPSETLLRLLYKKKINLVLFRENLGLTVEEFVDLLHDKLEINARIIYCLSKILGGSESFWRNRYIEFQEFVEASNNIIASSNNIFLKSLSEIRSTNIQSLSDDFKVSTLEHLIVDYYEMRQIMYSRNQNFEPSPAKLANWIRKCELVAEIEIITQSTPVFSAKLLKDIFPDIISLSKLNDVAKAIPRIKNILRTVGVILVLSPSEAGYGVSGFTKRILKSYRLVVVTDRYKNNASFWFTLLHEIAHCVLHDIHQTLIHYSDDEFILANSSSDNIYEEEEANNFIESLLFPVELKSQLQAASKSYKSLIKLAVSFDIPASLVAAQIHRLKLAPYSHFRKVYQPVKFDSIF